MIVFTRHARERYAERVPGGDFAVETARGRLQMTIPPGRANGESADAWFVCRRCVFPLIRDKKDYVAKTCLTRPYVTKEQRRWKREAARAEDWRHSA